MADESKEAELEVEAELAVRDLVKKAAPRSLTIPQMVEQLDGKFPEELVRNICWGLLEDGFALIDQIGIFLNEEGKK